MDIIYPIKYKELQGFISRIPSLVAYWPLNDVSGTVARNYAPQTINTLNGTIDGCAVNQPGQTGLSYYFDGTNDKVTIADNDALEGLSAVTVLFFLTSPDTTAYGKIFYKTDVYDIGINDVGEIFCNLAGVHNFGTLGSNPVIDDNVWRMFAITYDGATAKAYFNGTVVESQGGLSGSLATSVNSLILGNNEGTEWHIGNMQHVALFNQALTQTQITRLTQIARLA